MYLSMLDKLLDYCEAQSEPEAGLMYGQQILRYDRARERTHRRMMRLHYLAGDRTSALRQYHSCVQALAEELDVGPAKSTVALYNQIRADQVRNDSPPSPPPQLLPLEETHVQWRTYIDATDPVQSLHQIHASLIDLQRQIESCMRAFEALPEK
jgi:hypothetical protein